MKKTLLVILCLTSLNVFADSDSYDEYKSQNEQNRRHDEQMKQQRTQQDQNQANQLTNEWEAGMEERGAY